MTIACPTLDQRHAIANARASANLSVPLAWAALTLTGADALTFLQGQLSCDMKLVTAEQASLGCLLNLKGRIEASVVVVSIDGGYALLMPQAQIAAVKARLAKYGAFSKVSIAQGTQEIVGLMGAEALPKALAETSYATLIEADALYVRLPGLTRALKISEAAALAVNADASALAAWQAEAVASGEVTIDQALVDQWQPQELDYHSLNGVSYQKGCYMGQEIVARLYFRGQLKTGLCWLRAPWSETVDAALDWPIMADDKAVGRVIALAWPDEQQLWLLASVRLVAENLQWHLPNGDVVALTRHDFIRQA
ncbi:hypothetical protein [Paraperlucidibaca sp.]|uniref:CAF17-like 4Fe-4S cluster assembly/insertion protein YgfZ n=1 Tax=Paraperlucidibaca sp. TaxID=2708021 RepID=UPI0030F36F9B